MHGKLWRNYYIQWLKDNRWGIQYGAVLVAAVWLVQAGLWPWALLLLAFCLPLPTPPPSR
jgi:hypothetical protein